jgi:hypothetical protein
MWPVCRSRPLFRKESCSTCPPPKRPVLKPLVLPPELCAPVPAPKDVAVNLAIDAGQRFQTIDGFGTATYDCAKLADTAVAGNTLSVVLPPRCIVTLYGKSGQ